MSASDNNLVRVTITREPEWKESKKTGEPFMAGSGFVTDGKERVGGVMVPKRVRVDLLAFGQDAGRLDGLTPGEVVMIGGEWDSKYYQGRRELKCVVGEIQPVAEEAAPAASSAVAQFRAVS